ncbi:SDR family NAD(P)-dependent oxidoreductase [Tumebacillus permanentifrigoris]|uniref:Polysaccharide biosynthesis protein n=1 Tax=Tumebacillus permanentifrigoris TaxID=378543 RepID=A0A316DF18_9BACL|nr:SDR family NAD(P)-dependent oxidoreductase [Tumebacillus permanentifrigoris]PWK16178.1 polysaccharide biosynthesis protein [Tumebacillus permanentifrigoris]
MYTGKKILITGGTGTIGKLLTSFLLQHNPKVIRIFSRDEYKQFEMQREFLDHGDKLRFLIGDVRDGQRLARAMEHIDYVFHLAAMKHVPFCEYNPFEAVQTNVIGTQNVIQAAIQNSVCKVMFTSTDKAISPTNTYGATKLTAERLISAAEYQKGPKQTIFSSVRFGNVMGSRGSVIPLFAKQIMERRKITITDMKMTRYMMTPTQAISLMLKANDLAHGGEVFVLKMPTVSLSDLAEVIIEEVTQKYNLQEPVEIAEIGLRPGEKMYEELMTEDEINAALETSEMYIIPSSFTEQRIEYPEALSATPNHANSRYETPISKETLRDWILTERLV